MMYTTQINVLVHVLIAFSYTLTDGKLIIPTINAEIINRNHTSLQFSIRMFKSPFDNKLHFLVNRRSVNVMHFINSKCYNKSGECTAETCYCSYKDFSFTWYYPVNASSISSTFGVVMHIATGNYEEVIKIQISGLYDKSFFKVDKTFLDVVIPASDEKDKEIRIDDYGTTLRIILGIDMSTAVIVSACVAVFYTFFGGLYSVTYTDIAQFFLMSLGLILIIPFAWTNPAVDMSRLKDKWKGSLEPRFIGVYIDLWLLTIGGCFTWQGYYQRVHACKTTRIARDSVLVSAVLALLMGVPPAITGVIGAATDWNQTMYNGNPELSQDEWSNVLPMVLAYLCPMAVSVFGLGAVSAAVMSSADSIVLAAGSVISHNLYKNCFRPKASQRELTWVLRISILLTGILGAVIAIAVKSVYGLFILCVDAMYVIQMPELTCALWFEKANGYGSLVGFIVGLLFRILGGEPVVSLPALIKYPWYDPVAGQLFPHKTFAMMCCFTSIISVSFLTDYIFTNDKVDKKYDFFNCFQHNKIDPTDEHQSNAVQSKADAICDEKDFNVVLKTYRFTNI